MTQKTVEGQKRTKDLIKEYGGALNVPLTKSLLTHVSTANSTWKKHLDDEKKKEEIRKLDKLQADTERKLKEELEEKKKSWNKKMDDCKGQIVFLEDRDEILSKDISEKIAMLSDGRVQQGVLVPLLENLYEQQKEVKVDLKKLNEIKEKLLDSKPKK